MQSPTAIVNMDFNSTTPMDPSVIEAVKNASLNLWANPSSSYETGVHVKNAINESRQQVAKLIKCGADEIVFTSGGTEANNWIIYSAVNEFHKSRTDVNNDCVPHIISTNIEHDSIRLILESLLSDQKIEVTFVEVSKETGSVSAKDVIDSIRPNTVLITVMLANNETGLFQPVAKIAELLVSCNENRLWPKIRLHTDAAQVIGKHKLNVAELGVDYLTIVGHKFHGPRIGALYRKRERPLHPIFFGGAQENNLRSGTENTPMIVGLGVACQLICDNMKYFERRMTLLRQDMERQLNEKFKDLITINGLYTNMHGRLANTLSVTFNDPKLKGQKILSLCTRLRASVGAACHSGELTPSAVLIASGVDPSLALCTIRLSLSRQNRQDDVDVAVNELVNAVQTLLKTD